MGNGPGDTNIMKTAKYPMEHFGALVAAFNNQMYYFINLFETGCDVLTFSGVRNTGSRPIEEKVSIVIVHIILRLYILTELHIR